MGTIILSTPIAVLSRGAEDTSWRDRNDGYTNTGATGDPIGKYAATGILYDYTELKSLSSDKIISSISFSLKYTTGQTGVNTPIRIYTNVVPSNSYTPADLVAHSLTTKYNAIFTTVGTTNSILTTTTSLTGTEAINFVNDLKTGHTTYGDKYIYLYSGEDTTENKIRYFRELTITITYSDPVVPKLRYYNGSSWQIASGVAYYNGSKWVDIDVSQFYGLDASGNWQTPSS